MTFSLVLLAIFIDAVLYGAVVPILPAFAAANNISARLLCFIFSLYPIAILLFSLPLGILADKWGRKPLMILGMFGMVLATIIFASARSVAAWSLSRFFQGIAAAGTWTAGLALTCDLFPTEKRGQKIGIVGAASGIGLLIGPVMGGLLSQRYGCACPFYVCAFLALIAGIGFIFIKLERTARERIKLHRIPWSDARLIFSCITIILGISGIGILEPLLSLYLISRFHENNGSIGILFGFIALCYVLSQPFFGKLSDIYGRKPFILIGFIGTAVLYPFITFMNSFGLTFIIGGLLGVTLGLLITPAIALITEIFDEKGAACYGVSAGFYNIAFSIGLALGPILGGVVYERIGFFGTFTSYAVCMLLGGVAAYNFKLSKNSAQGPTD